MTEPTVVRLPTAQKIGAYWRLGKFQNYQMVLPILVAFTAVPPDTLRVGSGGMTAVLLFACGWSMCGVALVLDDIVGFREGLDEQTFASDGHHRPRSMKPLVTGEVSYEGAVRYVVALLALAALSGVIALVIAPHRSWLVSAILLTFALLNMQYSAGLRLSYRFGTELSILSSFSLLAIGPYVLLTGQLPGAFALQGLFLGTWTLQLSWFSYCLDADKDASVGRRSLASTFKWDGMRWLIGALFVANVGGAVAVCAAGVWPRWTLLLLVPSLVLQVLQVREGFVRRDLVRARALGFPAVTAGAVALGAMNVFG